VKIVAIGLSAFLPELVPGRSDIQFLDKLTDKGLVEGLPGFDLAPGKFP
jgi:hypothetical protein